ncbi:MAG: endonuclease III domain-containing protein [Halanaerobiaceae bacterium]
MYPCNYYCENEIELNITLESIYNKLLERFGAQEWWPAENDFETIVGAILTQSVSWTNVEKAISNLKDYFKDSGSVLLYPEQLRKLDIEVLAELIRPSGYYNMKAKKLKAFLEFLYNEYQGNLDHMFKLELESLRKRLLKVYGIGPETADSILLYAGRYPIFVIDAYTKRIMSRIGLTADDIDYHDLQKLIMDNIKPDYVKYNEYHALIVALAKKYCTRNRPDCINCPLSDEICG